MPTRHQTQRQSPRRPRADFFPPLRQHRNDQEIDIESETEEEVYLTTSADVSELCASYLGDAGENAGARQGRPSKFQNNTTGSSRDPKKMDSIISAELNQLGKEKRKLAYEDLHGVSDDEEEPNDETIASHISMLLKELRRIRERSALDKAMFLAPKYAIDPAFCLMFLRAERFDIKSAARRLVLHFKHKLDLFGLEKIARDIAIEDLSTDDQKALFTGSEQYLGKDQSGRTILFSTSKLRNYTNIDNQVRRHNRSNIVDPKSVIVEAEGERGQSRTFNFVISIK
jgi:hypothetical protein